MRSVIFFIFFAVISNACLAQPKGYQQLKDISAFQQALSKANGSRQTIASDFSQTKNLSLLADKIKSKGKFYFKKDDKVRIEYTSPYSYLLVMNGGQLMVKDEQKTNKINTKNSKAMQSVNRIIVDCMRGTVFQNPDFKVNAFDNTQSDLLSLVPITESMKKLFRQIDVYMDKKSMDVHRLTMTEQNGDYTDMDFTNTQHNANLSDALFKVK